MIAGCTGPNGTGPTGAPVSSTPAGHLTSDLYISDDSGYVLKVSPAGVLSVVAGNGKRFQRPTPGAAASSPIMPYGLAVDPAGNLYVADNLLDVVKISANGDLSMVAGGDPTPGPDSPQPYIGPVPGPAMRSPMHPIDVALDTAGNVHIADDTGYVLKVTPDGMMSIAAGLGKATLPPEPGPATTSPMSPAGIDLDRSGNVYLADNKGYVLKITPGGVLSIIASVGSCGGSTPGMRRACLASAPIGIAVDDAGNVYVAEGPYIDKIAPDGTISTVAGNGKLGQAVPGPAVDSPLMPLAVAVDKAGDVCVITHSAVYLVTPDGMLSLVAGQPDRQDTVPQQPTPGPATDSPVTPVGVALGP